jgi:hypothetical protein
MNDLGLVIGSMVLHPFISPFTTNQYGDDRLCSQCGIEPHEGKQKYDQAKP